MMRARRCAGSERRGELKVLGVRSRSFSRSRKSWDWRFLYSVGEVRESFLLMMVVEVMVWVGVKGVAGAVLMFSDVDAALCWC